jgi:hypothetical protein
MDWKADAHWHFEDSGHISLQSRSLTIDKIKGFLYVGSIWIGARKKWRGFKGTRATSHWPAGLPVAKETLRVFGLSELMKVKDRLVSYKLGFW